VNTGQGNFDKGGDSDGKPFIPVDVDSAVSRWSSRKTFGWRVKCQLSRLGRRQRQTVLEGSGWSLRQSSEWAGAPWVGVVARSLPILGLPPRTGCTSGTATVTTSRPRVLDS